MRMRTRRVKPSPERLTSKTLNFQKRTPRKQSVKLSKNKMKQLPRRKRRPSSKRSLTRKLKKLKMKKKLRLNTKEEL